MCVFIPAISSADSHGGKGQVLFEPRRVKLEALLRAAAGVQRVYYVRMMEYHGLERYFPGDAWGRRPRALYRPPSALRRLCRSAGIELVPPRGGRGDIKSILAPRHGPLPRVWVREAPTTIHRRGASPGVQSKRPVISFI